MMKKLSALCAMALILTMTLSPTAYAAVPLPSSACYPTSVIRSEDGA